MKHPLMSPFISANIAMESFLRNLQKIEHKNMFWYEDPNWRTIMDEMSKVEISVQVNGHTQGRMQTTPDEPGVGRRAQEIVAVADAIAGRKVKRVMYVPEQIVNIVTEA